MKLRHLFYLLLAPIGIQAQSIGIDVGISNANYQYRNSNGEKLNTLFGDSSTSIGIYTLINLPSSDFFKINVGLRYQGMDAYGYDVNVPLNYSTSYLSAMSELESTLRTFYLNRYCSSCSGINLKTGVGLEFAKIIRGTQLVGDVQSFDLTLEDEFNGILFGPLVSASLEFDLLFEVKMALKYTQTYFFNSHSSPERLRFNRGILSLGIIKEL